MLNKNKNYIFSFLVLASSLHTELATAFCCSIRPRRTVIRLSVSTCTARCISLNLIVYIYFCQHVHRVHLVIVPLLKVACISSHQGFLLRVLQPALQPRSQESDGQPSRHWLRTWLGRMIRVGLMRSCRPDEPLRRMQVEQPE